MVLSSSIYVRRGALYWAKWPPLVLLDERADELCPELGGLCEDLERAGRAVGLDRGVVEFAGFFSAGALGRVFPQLIPYLLQMLDARFAGPFSAWWRALKEGRLPSVAERWDVEPDPQCALPVACPVSHLVFLNTPHETARRLRKCLHVTRAFREIYGVDLWIKLADPKYGVRPIASPAQFLKPLLADLPPPEKLAACTSSAGVTRGARLTPLALLKYWADTGREPFIDAVLTGRPPVQLVCKKPLTCDKSLNVVKEGRRLEEKCTLTFSPGRRPS